MIILSDCKSTHFSFFFPVIYKISILKYKYVENVIEETLNDFLLYIEGKLQLHVKRCIHCSRALKRWTLLSLSLCLNTLRKRLSVTSTTSLTETGYRMNMVGFHQDFNIKRELATRALSRASVFTFITQTNLFLSSAFLNKSLV